MWNFFEPALAQWYRWKIDGASLWMRKNGEEWRFALDALPFKQIKSDALGPEPANAPESAPVIFVVAAGKKIALRPHPSAIPYLITARNEIKILPGSEAQFTIALPPLMRIEHENGSILYEFQPFIVHSTWFGDTMSGTLCRSLPIELDPQCKNEQGGFADSAHPEEVTNDPAIQESFMRATQYLACRSLIHCKIAVRNRSKELLEVKRIAIFTDLMNVYQQEEMLVSDTIIITATADGSLRTSSDAADYRHLKKVHAAQKSELNELSIMRGVSFLRSIARL